MVFANLYNAIIAVRATSERETIQNSAISITSHLGSAKATAV